MSLLQNSNAIPTGVTGYTLTNSLRFRLSASAYLSRTFGTPTSNTTWTWSSWVKRSRFGSDNYFIFGLSSYCGLGFTAADYLGLWSNAGSSLFTTPNKFRDPSAWYHVMYVANGTSVKIYINGELIYTYGSAPPTNINSAVTHRIGAAIPSSLYYDGYMTEIHFVDGQALTPSDFGEYNDITGVWQPKEYTGTYGNNGFYLDMSTSGSTVTDQSGNGNDWTATNMNLTTSTATTYDIMSDVPTLTNEDTGNFCTINAVNKDSTVTLVDGNLQYSATVSGYRPVYGTMGAKSGKWYMEMKLLGQPAAPDLGWFEHDANPTLGGFNQNTRPNLYGVATDGTGNSVLSFNNTSTTTISSGTGWATNDIIGCAIDMDNKKIWFHRNGTWYPASSGGTAGNPSAGTNPTITYSYDDYLVPRSACYSSNYNALINFGQRPFAYTPPTGYKKLNTYNLPDSNIVDGSQYMNPITYTGNGTSQSITGVGFSPDLVWIKYRDSTGNNELFDTVRGAGQLIVSNLTVAESTATNKHSSFDSDGFSVGSALSTNTSGGDYVSWNWRGSDSTAVSNTDGSITSTVSANTTSGFSIVSWVATGANGTIGHGLNALPALIITKDRDTSSTWFSYHSSLGATKVIYLNGTSAAAVSSNKWNDTEPTSSVFSVGSGGTNLNTGNAAIAYCFAEVEGFSKFGIWETINVGGTPAAGFVYTGFKPKLIIWKAADTSNSYTSWGMQDTERTTYNGDSETLHTLWANANYAEGTRGGGGSSGALGSNGFQIDFLSNGFNIIGGGNSELASSGTYIYMAWAENPFKNSLAR